MNDRSSTSILETVVGSEPIEQEKPKSLLEAHQQKQKTDKAAAPVDPAAERERKIKEVRPANCVEMMPQSHSHYDPGLQATGRGREVE